MSQLHQIQLQFDPHQDRAVLRISTTDQSEYLFWLTRRFVKLMWQALMKIVENDVQVSAQADPGNKKAVLAFQHEQAVQAADFDTKYEKQAAKRPLGDAPILLAKLQLKKSPQGTDILSLTPMDGQGVELRVDRRMVHSLCKLLTDVSKKAEWNLSLSIAPPAARNASTETPAKLN